MKLITKKQQKKINELNIEKLRLALEIGYTEYNHKTRITKDLNDQFKIIAKDIYLSDAVII